MHLPVRPVSALSANGTLPFGRRRGWLGLFAAVMVTSAAYAATAPERAADPTDFARVRVARQSVGSGAELLTIFVALPPDEALHYREMPVLSVLRDTLGTASPQTERLRDVWLLTAGRASAVNAVESAIPFIYWLHTPKPSSSVRAVHLVDFGSPLRQTEGALAGLVVQGELLDPSGRTLRTTSRSFRANDADDSRARAAEAVAALADAEEEPSTPSDVAEDLARLHARLLLSCSLLGGLVRDQSLVPYHDRQQTEVEITRGHNWDLLRQAAEKDKLYFEPLSLGKRPDYAMLWVRRSDLDQAPRSFDAKLLHIANPFHDGRISGWRGYSEQWWFDENGRRLDGEASGAMSDQVIPLALYSLDHPRVPLLLVDFQNGGAPRRRESAGQAATDVTRGLLGWSPVANWDFFVAQSVVTFVRSRQGAASDPAARVRAWAELSYALSADGEIRPGLRTALEQHVHAPVFDPMNAKVDAEADLAWRRLRLLTGPDSPLPQIVEEHRRRELAALEHGHAARFGFAMLHVGTIGIYQHRDDTEDITERLSWSRRMAWNREYLSRVAAAPSPVELTWDPEQIRASIAAVRQLTQLQPLSHDDISPVLARLAVSTEDDSIRHLCFQALHGIGSETSREELARLARQPDRFDCPACREYLAHESAAPLQKNSFSGAQ